MRIEQLRLVDVGPFTDLQLDLPQQREVGETILLEGPNGSGKTTLAEAIAAVFSGDQGEDVGFIVPSFVFAEGSPRQVPHPVARVRQRFRSQGAHIKAVVAHEGLTTRIEIESRSFSLDAIAASGGSDAEGHVRGLLRGKEPVEWAAFAFRGHAATPQSATEGPKGIESAALEGALSFGEQSSAQFFGQLLVNRNYERMQAADQAGALPDGAERARLQEVARRRREAMDRIVRALSSVLACDVSVEFPLGATSPRVKFNGDHVPLEFLGEGMRSTMAWLTDLLIRLDRIRWKDPDRSPLGQPMTLILDEIDESLHPRAQAKLLPTLRDLLPNATIIATTHSPFVVASAASGVVFSLRPDPVTRRVGGVLQGLTLEPGQSVDYVVEAVFETQAGIIDPNTRANLDQHKRDVESLGAGRPDVDRTAFARRRKELMALNDEVRTIVTMREYRVRDAVSQILAVSDVTDK